MLARGALIVQLKNVADKNSQQEKERMFSRGKFPQSNIPIVRRMIDISKKKFSGAKFLSTLSYLYQAPSITKVLFNVEPQFAWNPSKRDIWCGVLIAIHLFVKDPKHILMLGQGVLIAQLKNVLDKTSQQGKERLFSRGKFPQISGSLRR